GVALNLSAAANERAIGKTVMPLFHAFYSMGTVAGAAVGSLLLLLGVPTGAHLIGIGALGIAATLILVRYLRPAEQAPEPGEEHHRSRWTDRLAAWRDPRVL